MKKDSAFFRLVEELADLDRRLFGSVAGVDECGAAECGDDPGQTMPATIGELHLVYELFKRRDSIHQQLNRLPSFSIPGRKNRISWRRPPQYLHRLLAALIERGYITNTSVEAIIGHFDVPGYPDPIESIKWKDDKWMIGALFAALSGTGAFGKQKRHMGVDGKVVIDLPDDAPRWAVDHFAGIASKESFRENWRKSKKKEEGIKCIAALLEELHIA